MHRLNDVFVRFLKMVMQFSLKRKSVGNQ